MELDTKLRLNRSDYTFFKAYYLLGICLTGIIDDHQRLLFPYSSTTASPAFPSALLYHPRRRHLDHSVRKVIMRNLAISSVLSLRSSFDTLEMFTADNRILEEATCTAHN